MKLVQIPKATIESSADTDKTLKRKGENWPWWRIPYDKIPEQGILARSIGTGCIRPGFTVYLIGGHDRDIFIGPDCTKFKIHEYVGLVDGTGWQPLVQLGCDVEMV